MNKSRKDRHNKTLDFMDVMVRWVFFGTFIFTTAVMVFVWQFGWENILLNLMDRWFTIMVSELIIMGVIQIAKRGVEVVEVKEETKKEIIIEQERGEDIDGY